MSTTKIEWAEKSWNPITGCTKVSEGCKNCYAERMAKRLAGRYGYPKDDPFRVTFHPDRLDQPLRWKKPSTIFVCSMSDLFHEDVNPKDIDAVFDVMAEAKQHQFILLTKRPQNIKEKLYGITEEWPCRELGGGDYLPNVFLGVTVENQDAMWRVGELLKIPAAGYWISAEPMLGPLDIRDALHGYPEPYGGEQYLVTREMAMDAGDLRLEGQPYQFGEPNWQQTCPPLSGVVLGGESGPGARPMHPDWARGVRDQCADSGVPFMFKQWGAWAPCYEASEGWWCLSQHTGNEIAARIPNNTKILENKWDESCVSRVGAKRAGRLLGGREHNETAWRMPV